METLILGLKIVRGTKSVQKLLTEFKSKISEFSPSASLFYSNLPLRAKYGENCVKIHYQGQKKIVTEIL